MLAECKQHCLACLVYDEQHSMACDAYFMMSSTQHSMACDACFMMSSTPWHMMFTLSSIPWHVMLTSWSALHGIWCLLHDEQHSMACDAYFMMSSVWHHTLRGVCIFPNWPQWKWLHSIPLMFFDLLISWILQLVLSYLSFDSWWLVSIGWY